MKKIFLLFIIISSAVIAKAQGNYDYPIYGVGFDASTIRGFTNVAKQNNTLSAGAYFSYYPSPFWPVTVELQRGRLWGGSRVTDPYSREYVNNYTGFLIHTDIQLGELVDYRYSSILDLLKNGYLGIGTGFINSNVKNQRYDLFSQGYPAGTYEFPGKDNSLNPEVDFRLGYEFKFYDDLEEPRFRLHIEYVHHIVFGEGLDGYDDPATRFKNDHPDQYRQITIGLIYNFGIERAYTKFIRNPYY